MRSRALISIFALIALPTIACSQSLSLTDQQIADLIIKQSRDAYYATGHPCACPDDAARNGSRCGLRSAYSRPGGAEPKCYPKDVTPQEIKEWRDQHRGTTPPLVFKS